MAIELQERAKNHNSYIYADLFEAVVVSVDPGTNIIIVAPDGQNNHARLQGVPLSSTFSAALGFVETVLPTIGTRVLCVGKNDNNTLIIGSIPYPDNQGDTNDPSLPNKAILGTQEPLFQSVHKNGYLDTITKSFIHNNNLPSDVLQGEKVISNEFGVMMGLFKLMATLKGSELAQIQCHFLDDLVRIVSHNFQHYSSLGELKVFHDGKGIHLEAGATHIPKESLGQGNDGAGVKTIEQVTDYDQFYTLDEDQSVMLERMKLFVGQLGQFVNLLITMPSPESHALDGDPPTTPDTGLLQVKASLDGTLVVRSVSGIYLEKTNWIRVPTRIRTPEDPLGDDGTTITYPKQTPYQFDNHYQYRNTAFLYYLQLRDYLAYINEEVGYANFNAQTKDFYVNKDKTKETPLQSITYVDPETGVAYTQTKSWVSLMGNGGISLSDAWGSCISMEGGNIYIQPAKDLVVQPNRNLIGKIGGNIAIAAKKEIDLSSTEGGMRVKTNYAQYLYSKQGGIVLHTDGPNYAGNYITWDGDPDSMITGVAGLLLLAPNSSVNAYAQQVFLDATDTIFAKSDSITLSSTSDSIIMSGGETILYGDEVSLFSTEATISYSQGESIILGLGGTIVGQKGQYFGQDSFGGGVEGLLDPTNNQDSTFFSDLAAELSTVGAYTTSDFLGSFQTDTDFTDIQFQFPPTDLYTLDLAADVIPQTLSQQTDNFSGMYSLQTWVEQSVNDSYPYPGKDFNMSLATATVNNIDTNLDAGVPLANKAVNLEKQSTIVVKDIFLNYKSM